MRNLKLLPTFLCFAFIFGLVFANLSSAQKSSGLEIEKFAKEIPETILDEITRVPDKPHFLLGLEPRDDVWLRFLETRKIWRMNEMIYGENYAGIIDRSQPDYKARNSEQIHESITINGKQVKIIYTHHLISASSNLYVFLSKLGEKNLAEFSPFYRKYEVQWALGQITQAQWQNIQYILGWTQFEAVKNFIHEYLRDGLEKNIKDYAEINLTEKVLESRAKLLDDPEYRDHLDDPVAGTSLKVRDIIPVPLTRIEDFLPDILIIGPGPGMGFANIKTPGTERIVSVDLLAIMFDYVNNKRVLIAHELTHTNPYLQSTPLDFRYDLEMWADLTTNLGSDNLANFLFHPYLAIVRNTAKTYFGYDAQEAIRKIWPGEFGVRDVREKEFRRHAAEVKKIEDEMTKFIKDPEDGLMVNFYRDPYFWITINTKFCDKAAAWNLMFALKYEPAGVFDPNKKDKDGQVIPPAIQTKEWLSQEEDAGRIQRLAKKALEKTGTLTKEGEKMSKESDLADVIKCPVDSRTLYFDAKEKNKFLEIVKSLIGRSNSGDWEARMTLFKIFGLGPAIKSIPPNKEVQK